MFCNHCGQPIPDDSGFCPCCGAVLDHGRPRRQPAPARRPRRSEPYPTTAQYGDARYQQPRPRPAQLDPKHLWIERDDGLGSLMRHFHAQDHGRWKAIAMAGAVVCGLTLLLPWYTVAFFGYEVLDFFNIFADGIRSSDWLIIALASAAVVVTLYLGHPMWSMAACVFLCYFAISNVTSLFWTFGFMHLTLGFLIYFVATAVTTYGCLAAGGLEELNLFLPGPTPRAGFTYPDPTDPHIPRGDAF